MSPEEADALGAEAAPPMIHYFVGYVQLRQPGGSLGEKHFFTVRAPDQYAAFDMVREEMGLSDRDAVTFFQRIGYNNA